MKWQVQFTRFAAIVVLSVGVALCTESAQTDSSNTDRAQTAPSRRPARISGYLSPEALPQGLAFIPAPPENGSAAFALDEEISRKSLDLQGTPRWELAAEDAEINSPRILEAFSCALNVPVNANDTPRLCLLLARSLTDTTRTVRIVKNQYRRPRPYLINKKPICTPEYQTQMEGNGSYPSSHAAIGWVWALVLSEIAPDRADATLARGLAFGHSRIVCNVHWNSDVVEGRILAAAIVARLHAEPAFRADLDLVKAEIVQARAKRLKPGRQCFEEAAALAITRPSK